MLVKKTYVGHYEPLETISRFVRDVEYIEKLPALGGDTKFWFEVAMVGSDIEDFWNYPKMKEMLPYLKLKQARLAICYMREFPFAENEWVQMQSRIGEQAANDHNVDPGQIFYFYGNNPEHLESLHKRRVNVIEVPYFEIDFVHRYLHKEIEICHPIDAAHKNPPRQFLDMNGKPHKYMRLRHVVHLWNKRLVDKGIINLLRGEGDYENWTKDKYYELVSDIITEKDWEKFWKWWPNTHDAEENIDKKVFFGKHHPGYPYDKKLFLDTFMSLVSETHSGHCNPYPHKGKGTCNPQFFLSEKLVKAIGNCHPFIILSTPNYLEKLKEFGYQTFDPHINESYDKELDPELRMVKALDQIEKICKDGLPVATLEIAIANQTNLVNRYFGFIDALTQIIEAE